jgi:ectoine hydroxylase-related dioxygenase (phytanoyl-CoA dioxygenase family)
MKTGSMLMYDGAFIHSAGENTSDSWRPAISMQFVAGWIRPAYNFSLSVPIELARTFPRQLQQLCGFGIYKGGYIGRLEGEHSAIDLLLS